MSIQENMVHASDSIETAKIELNRFFDPSEIFDYKRLCFSSLYAIDEV
jgi:nucleoside-diphosphate kinase